MGTSASKFGDIPPDYLNNLTAASLHDISSDKELAKIQRIVLEQYPYLSDIQESMLVTDVQKPDGPIVFANDCFEKMTLYPKEEILGRNCRFLQGKHSNPMTVTRIREAVREGKGLEIEILNYRKDGVAFWNHFLMLPVYKAKKLRYFVAIQKNVTLFKEGNPPALWTAAEVAMWLEYYGLPEFNQRIIKYDVTGKIFLRLNKSRCKKMDILLLSDLTVLLEAVTFLRDHIEAPFMKKQETLKKVKYNPSKPDAANGNINQESPAELEYWERENAAPDTLLFKAYYKREIYLFLWPSDKAYCLEVIKTEIAAHFGLQNVQLTFVDFSAKKGTTLYTNDQLEHILYEVKKSTIKFYVEECDQEILSLSSILYSVPDPILIVNGALEVLFANGEAKQLFKVSNRGRLANAVQLFPELPVDFPKYPHIRTVAMVGPSIVPVELTISGHGESFLFVLRRYLANDELYATESFSSVLSETSNSSTKPYNTQEDQKQNDERHIIEDALEQDSSPPVTLSEDTSEVTVFEDPIQEGEQVELRRTLDQLLFTDLGLERIPLFLAAYKLFHSKEILLREIETLVRFYQEQKGGASVNLLNFYKLLSAWTDCYPKDFRSYESRNHLVRLLEILPDRAASNAIKLKLIKTAHVVKERSIAERYSLNLISHTSPEEIANALTAKDMHTFQSIQTIEFYKCAWMKEDRNENAPHLTAMSNAFVVITNWISQAVLVEGAKKRAKRIQKFINIASRLLKQHNYQSMMAIVSGLDVVHVSRMKRTWAVISQQSKNALEDMRLLMEPRNNFALYRKALGTALANGFMFVIPYMPVILRDVAYIYESLLCHNYTMDNVEIMGKQMDTLLKLQSRSLPNDFVVKDSLLHFFESLNPQLDEEEMYQKSLKLEPIEGKRTARSLPTILKARGDTM